MNEHMNRMKITGQTFRNEQVSLDYITFVKCRFENVTFVYRGMTPIQWKDCEMENCRFTVDGPAANTLLAIEDLRADETLREVVESILSEAAKMVRVARAANQAAAEAEDLFVPGEIRLGPVVAAS